MLDHTIVLFGSGMGYGGTHSNRNLPIMVAGGGFKHLGHVDALVQAKANELGDVEPLKEGIVSILVSPQFLLLNTEDDASGERFAWKFGYFLSNTIPNEGLRKSVADGKLISFSDVRAEVQRRLDRISVSGTTCWRMSRSVSAS